ncbi:MAG: flavin reductase family protein [Candidatus Adiutrix sp.]|jgi:flavin reductase (DIM6/NTAB) family NADH-FMN oxidoreductase RutF|nr:flavin reductase family protein [Candidatus Adiutrix sp.]
MAKKKPTQEEFPLERAFTFVESGPVILVSTWRRRKRNLMTVSCHASLGFEPTIGLVLGPWNHSYDALVETGECVIAIPPASLMEAVVEIGNCSGAEVDKFKRFGLTPLPASEVKAPLVAECLRNLECRVVDREMASRHLFILEGVKAWHNPLLPDQRTFHANGDGTFVIDGETINLRHKMTKWQDCI